MKYNEIEKKLKKTLKPKRYTHTLNVIKSALELSEKYPCNCEKVRYAALLHDCAKNYSDQALIETANQYYLKVDEVTKREPQLLHGPVGAVVARQEYGIEDKEILSAIKYHTTGRENMTVLEKIIYLADFIEPGRKYPGVDALREIAFEDLDDAMIQALTNTIRYITNIKGLIHERTVSARNYLILEKMDHQIKESD
ncbi:MAG: bis(5'-nucleosyl)-tetraphosphatase (symmetrical) YqeK [Eubacterium sp.]